MEHSSSETSENQLCYFLHLLEIMKNQMQFLMIHRPDNEKAVQ